MTGHQPTIADLVLDLPVADISPEAERIVQQAGGRVQQQRVDAEIHLPLWTAQQGTMRRVALDDGPKVAVWVPPGSRPERDVEVEHDGRRYYIRVLLLAEPGIRVRDGDLHGVAVVPDEDCQRGGITYVRTGPGYPTKLWVRAGTRDGTLYRLPGLGLPDPLDPEACGDFCVLVRKQSRYGSVPAPATPHTPPTKAARAAPQPRRGTIDAALQIKALIDKAFNNKQEANHG